MLAYREVHFWQHTIEKNAGTIIIQVEAATVEHKIRQQVISYIV